MRSLSPVMEMAETSVMITRVTFGPTPRLAGNHIILWQEVYALSQVLVAFATKNGSAEEVAAAIAGSLRDSGCDVDLRRARRPAARCVRPTAPTKPQSLTSPPRPHSASSHDPSPSAAHVRHQS
jgi:hypothetical protein